MGSHSHDIDGILRASAASVRLLEASTGASDSDRVRRGLTQIDALSGLNAVGANVSVSSSSGENRFGAVRVWDNVTTTGWCRLDPTGSDQVIRLGSPHIVTFEVEEPGVGLRELKIKTFTGSIGGRPFDNFPGPSLALIGEQAARKMLSLHDDTVTSLVERSPWHRANTALSSPAADQGANSTMDNALLGLEAAGRQSGNHQVRGEFTGKKSRTEYGTEYEVLVSWPAASKGKMFWLLPKDFEGSITSSHFIEEESCVLTIASGGHMASSYPHDSGRKGRAYHSLEEWVEDGKGVSKQRESGVDQLRNKRGPHFIQAPLHGVSLQEDNRAKGARLTQGLPLKDSRGVLVRPEGVLTGRYFWLGHDRVVELQCSEASGDAAGTMVLLNMTDFTGTVTHKSRRGWVEYQDGVVGQPQGDLASITEDTTQEELSF